MPHRVQILLTEAFFFIASLTGLLSYMPDLVMILDIILKLISIASFTFLIIINWDKAIKRIKKFFDK